MSSLFDNSLIKRVSKGGYVGKERYEIYMWNGSVIIVSDPYEMQRLEKIIKEVTDFVTRHDIQDTYYSMLTDKLIEEGW